METKQNNNNNILKTINETRELGGYYNQNTGKTYSPSILVQISKNNGLLADIIYQFLNAKDPDGNIKPNVEGIEVINKIKEMVANELKPIAQIHCDEQREYRAKQREIWSAKNVRNYSETVAGTVTSE